MTRSKKPDDMTPTVFDPAAVYEGINRKLLTFIGMPRRCREPACRRRKQCVGRDMRCQRDFPPPPSRPEDIARMTFEIKRELERLVAERAAE